jgi:HlyD family secretion protein
VSKSLFRREALDKLSSPEQLDTLLKVTNPLAWLALVATMIFTVVAVGWALMGSLAVQVSGPGVLLPQGGVREVPTLLTGVVTEVLVRPGQLIPDGAVVIRMQPASSEDGARIEVVAERGGQVLELLASPGQYLTQGDTILMLGEPGASIECVAYFAFNQGDKVDPGMSTRVALSNADQDIYGSIIGEVTQVAPYPTTRAEMQSVLADAQLVDYFLTAGDKYQQAPLEIRVRLKRDLDDPTTYLWTSGHGPARAIRSGTSCQVQVVTEYVRPIELAIPKIRKFLDAVNGQ